MRRLLTTLGTTCLLAAASQAQGTSGAVTVFVEASGTEGDVRVFDEQTGSEKTPPLSLQGIALLSIDVAGRTPLDEFDSSRARFCEDIPGASRLALPNDRGSLYHYSRLLPDGTKRYGYLYVDPRGTPHDVCALPGFGPFDSDPFLPRVAVAPDGGAFLCATFLTNDPSSPGGELMEVDLRTSAVRSPSAGIEPRRYTFDGLGLQATWGVAMSRDGILRFDRGSGVTTELSFGGSPKPPWFSGDVVFSANGEWAVTTAGRDSAQVHVYVFGETGIAKRVTHEPGRLANGGFLPETGNGPFLAVSDDGTLAAWREVADTSAEGFIGRVPDGAGAGYLEQITRPERFTDYLDEIGVFKFIGPTTLVMGIGEELDASGTYIHDLDLYTVRLDPDDTEPEIRNVTLTSGQIAPPFTILPALRPQRFVWVEEAQAFLIYNRPPGLASGEILLADPELVGTQLLVRDIETLDFLHVTPNGILFSVERLTLNGPVRELYRMRSELDGPALLFETQPATTTFDPPVVRRDGWAAWVTDDGTTETLRRMKLETGNTHDFALTAAEYGPALGFSSVGSVMLSYLDQNAMQHFQMWPFASSGNQAIELSISGSAGTNGFLLPGL